MDIQIIVDSCCDLTPALRNLLRVSVASLKIDVGSIHYVDDERIDTKKLIADMKAYKNAPSTACPERALMLKKEFLEKCAALREVILVPTSGLSTVYAYDGGIVLAY